MKLCLHCARVGLHALGCSADGDGASVVPDDPKAKHERVVAAMDEVKKLVADAERKVAGAPRESLEIAWVAHDTLEHYSAGDLQTFDAKRAFNDLSKSIGKTREKASDALNDGEAAAHWDDLTFGRKALELLGDVVRRRREAATFDLSALGKLPRARVNYAREEAQALDGVCLEMEARLAESIAVEKDVESWGSVNLPAIASGSDPAMIPAGKIPSAKPVSFALAGGTAVVILGMVLDATHLLPRAASLGIVGAGFAAVIAGGVIALGRMKKRAALPAQFREIGVRYKERIYLSAALRLLRIRTSRLQNAEESLKKFTGGDNAPKWKRVKTEAKDALKFFVDWDGKRPIEDALGRAIAEAIGRKGKLRNFDEIASDEWDVLAKALALDFAAGDEAQRFDALAATIAENEAPAADLARVRKETLDAWSQGGERASRRFSKSAIAG